MVYFHIATVNLFTLFQADNNVIDACINLGSIFRWTGVTYICFPVHRFITRLFPMIPFLIIAPVLSLTTALKSQAYVDHCWPSLHDVLSREFRCFHSECIKEFALTVSVLCEFSAGLKVTIHLYSNNLFYISQL